MHLRAGLKVRSDTFLMLVIAVIALATSTLIIEAMHRICVPAVTVLFEALPRLASGSGAFAHVDNVLIDGIERKSFASRGDAAVRQNESLEVRGWAFDPARNAAAGGVFLVVDSGPSFRATYGGYRTKSGADVPRTSLAGTGFYGVVPTQSIALGAHLVHVRVVAADLSGYYEVRPAIVIDVR